EHLAAVDRSWQGPPVPTITPARPWSLFQRLGYFLREEARGWLFWKIDGPTPATLTKAAPSEFHRLLGIFEQICQTVAHAHSRTVTHRDLNPTTVMVGAFAEAQVRDWGLANPLPEAALRDTEPAEPTASDEDAVEPCWQTRWGYPIGTLPYSPPEQA